MSFKNKIFKITDKILPEIIRVRQNIHRYPELAGQEVQTSRLVRNILSFTDIKLLKPFIGSDAVGILRGGKPGKNVTLRADMDALPLDELNELPYRSEHPGKMHACGHDGHTAMLLGTALALNEFKEEISGSVRFVFQPGEEIAAMGKALVDAGALLNPEPAAVFALHAISGLPAGMIASRPGTIMAAAGFFKIVVTGRGGHGSRPELTIDPIIAACKVVDALQTICSRNIAPQDAAVISVCRLEGGKNANVIPESVILEGTVRFLEPEVGELLPGLIERAVKGICEALGASYEFEYALPYIPTVNNIKIYEFAKKISQEYFGGNNWLELPRSLMAGEDFSYYLHRYPGVFCNIGMGEKSPEIHNMNFNFNDDALRNGIAFMTGAAIEFLNRN
jgi:amidohydrolase